MMYLWMLLSWHVLTVGDQEPWVAPETAAEVKNPVEAGTKSLQTGKKIYTSFCWSCHGTTGLGDGPAAAGMDPKPVAFNTSEFQNQTDGAIFWKISEGRGNMASYKSMLSSTERWSVVNYLRTLKTE
ncbi:MAG: cytochrome c [Crocinitomicaceae bacterium]|nr:cytochrome c [Crocinitomicaceae bacterium]MBK8927077.1 cytochrome c [Crocinitomicaceae bacterium]